MTWLKFDGVDCILTDTTAAAIIAEIEEVKREKETLRRQEREESEKLRRWFMFHWHARRWAMYGNTEDYALFSDMFKDETGVRPDYTTEEIFDLLYRRDCRMAHGPWHNPWR